MTRRTLMKHQRFAIRFIRSRNGQAGVFMAPGTGKTLVAIRWAEVRLPALVVCRRDDYLTWELELEEEGVDLEDVGFIENGSEFYEGYDWTVVTHGLMRNQWIAKAVKNYPYQTVIVDEGHAIRHWKSRQTKSHPYFGS